MPGGGPHLEKACVVASAEVLGIIVATPSDTVQASAVPRAVRVSVNVQHQSDVPPGAAVGPTRRTPPRPCACSSR